MTISPWDKITVPEKDFNVRLVSDKTAVPCFWGRDANGSCLFIVELQGDHATQYRKDAVTAHGVDVDLREIDQKQCLVLALAKQVDRDLFTGFCRTLATALGLATDSASSLAVSLAHIRRWKTFLSGRSQHLSTEEVRGLFAEIVFLMELIDQKASSIVAVEAWLGSEGSHQDFIFGNTAVEIKSLSGTERSVIRISSEDQLESLNDRLFLRLYRLGNLPDSVQAQSLNDIVTAVQNRLDDADAIEALDRKLTARGYAPLPEYDLPRLIVSEMHSYRIGEGFPRLVRSQIPAGIANVAYDIKLEAIAFCECEATTLFME
ncbi:MAG: PD-(D/E)XK motif protein [Betaproteobacteria bacterium]|nr:PD-(D/E)XK motif protein [Betaproteobacteria bacterium]